MKNKSLFLLLTIIGIISSIFLGGIVPTSASEITYKEITVTAEQLQAMFDAGDITVDFSVICDSTDYRVRYYLNGTNTDKGQSFLISATDSFFVSQSDGSAKTTFFAKGAYRVTGDDGEIFDSASLIVDFVLPFEGKYNNSVINIDFFTVPDRNTLDFEDPLGSYSLFYNNVKMGGGNLSFLNKVTGAWSDLNEVLGYPLSVIYSASGLTFPASTNFVGIHECSFTLNSNGDIIDKLTVNYGNYWGYNDEERPYMPFAISLSDFVILVPDIPVDPDDPDVPVDPDDPDVPVDPDDPDGPTYADIVEGYLDNITNPTPEGQAKAEELKNALDSASADLEQMGDDLSVDIPDIGGVIDDLPTEAIDGLGLLGQNFLYDLLNQRLVIVIFTMVFSLIAIKLILFGSGAS